MKKKKTLAPRIARKRMLESLRKEYHLTGEQMAVLQGMNDSQLVVIFELIPAIIEKTQEQFELEFSDAFRRWRESWY